MKKTLKKTKKSTKKSVKPRLKSRYIKPEPIVTDESKIVEFSYNSDQQKFIIRLLSGKIFALSISDLPQKFRTKKTDWDNTVLLPNRSSLVVPIGNEGKMISSVLVQEKGHLI